MRIAQNIVLAFLSLLALSACQTGPSREPPEVAARFADNTAAYKPETEDQRLVLGALSKLKRGHETFDVSLMENILGSEFERRVLVSSDKIAVEGREQFLSARSAWNKTGAPRRQLHYSISGMASGKNGKSITVVALSTYKTKYFSPRFLETLRFEAIDGRWYLTRQTMLPMSPGRPGDHGVQIFVVSWDIDLAAEFSDLSVSNGPDFVIDRIRKKTAEDDDSSGSGILKQLLVVFREPPAVGTVITVEHHWPAEKTSWPLYHFEHEVKTVKPFFVLENLITLGCCPDHVISFSVFVNGARVASESVRGG